MSGRSLKGIRRVVGRYLEDIWRFDGGCLEGVWNKNPHLKSTGRKGPMHLEIARGVSESCLRGV